MFLNSFPKIQPSERLVEGSLTPIRFPKRARLPFDFRLIFVKFQSNLYTTEKRERCQKHTVRYVAPLYVHACFQDRV